MSSGVFLNPNINHGEGMPVQPNNLVLNFIIARSVLRQDPTLLQYYLALNGDPQDINSEIEIVALEALQYDASPPL